MLGLILLEKNKMIIQLKRKLQNYKLLFSKTDELNYITLARMNIKYGKINFLFRNGGILFRVKFFKIAQDDISNILISNEDFNKSIIQKIGEFEYLIWRPNDKKEPNYWEKDFALALTDKLLNLLEKYKFQFNMISNVSARCF